MTKGGVGTHFVQVVIETKITKYFNYSALFYGFPNQHIDESDDSKNEIRKY